MKVNLQAQLHVFEIFELDFPINFAATLLPIETRLENCQSHSIYQFFMRNRNSVEINFI